MAENKEQEYGIEIIEPDDVTDMTSDGKNIDYRTDTRGTELYESLTKKSNPERVDKTTDKEEFGFWFRIGRFFRRGKIKK